MGVAAQQTVEGIWKDAAIATDAEYQKLSDLPEESLVRRSTCAGWLLIGRSRGACAAGLSN